jgi:HEAT repeat protein
MGVTEHMWRILPAVRRHERSRALFFTGLLTLVTAAQTVGLAGSEALFLAELSAQRLPLAFVIASLVTVFGSVLYAARVGVVRNDGLFVQMLLGAGVALIAVPFATGLPQIPLLYALIAAFYLTQSVFTNHFWTFSGDYFDTLTSKRLFPVFTVGASVGGLFGGLGGALTAQLLGPLATIGLWGVLLCAAAAALWLARHSLIRWGPVGVEEADETSVESMRGAVGYLRGSRFGRWLVLSSTGMVLALFIAQYVYSDLFVRAHPDPGELAVFISVYLAVTNLVEIALELWVTPWLIRRFGVASSHVVHPILTLASFGALFASPVLATAILARANRELVENAVAQPVRTLVFNALPARFRGRIRAFLEGIVVYGGMTAAGLLLLALESPDLRTLAGVGAVAAVLYLAANLGARRAYLRTLIQGIRTGSLDITDLDSEIGEWQESRLADLCDELLRAETERPSRSLLQLIPSLGQRGVLAPLLRGLDHASGVVRATCARALLPHIEARAQLAAHRDDPDPRVRAHAAAALPEASERIAEMLRSANREDRLAALEVADASFASEALACADDPDPEVRAAAIERIVTSIGHVPDAVIERALEAAEPRVREAALRAATMTPGSVGSERIATALADSAIGVRNAAARALAAMGEAGALAALPYASDAGEDTATAALFAVAWGEHPRRRNFVVGELRRRVELAWEAIVGTTFLPLEGDIGSRFLHMAVSDTAMRHRRIAFQALELLESRRVVRRVEGALQFGTSRARGDALEVLSNLGDREAARLLVLMHETSSLRDRLAALGPDVHVAANREAFYADAALSDDRWTRLALAAVRGDVGDTASSFAMERLLALKRVPLFENLNLDQLDAVAQLTRDAAFLPGEVIMREGEPGGELYLLLEGRAEAWLDYEGPNRKRLGEIGKGEYMGEIAILDNEPRSASVVVVEQARALVLDGDSLKALVMQMPEIAFELLRVMTARVRASERRLLESGK